MLTEDELKRLKNIGALLGDDQRELLNRAHKLLDPESTLVREVPVWASAIANANSQGRLEELIEKLCQQAVVDIFQNIVAGGWVMLDAVKVRRDTIGVTSSTEHITEYGMGSTLITAYVPVRQPVA